ncbi:MAG: hypothetical protein JW922_08595, partial [Paludibacteraceae bacterium]|nr:hypothetical protein [Paludibacteraceae bacterium]
MESTDAINCVSTDDIEINVEEIQQISTSEKSEQQLNEIVGLAHETNEQFEKTVEELEKEGD